MFFFAYLLTTLSPGPNVLLVLKNSVQLGWKSAFITILGNLSCQFLVVCLVAVGVGTLIQELPFWFVMMKVIGGLYLVYLGIRNLKGVRNSSFGEAGLATATDKSNVRLFLEAFGVSASNPKTLIFLSAFLPQFLDITHSAYEQFAIMFITICVIVTAVHFGYSFSIAYFGKRFSFRRFERMMAKITGGLFIAMGGSMLLSNRA